MNVIAIDEGRLSGLREAICLEKLGSDLSGYENAVVQTLYIPLGLAILIIVGAAAMERKSTKKQSYRNMRRSKVQS